MTLHARQGAGVRHRLPARLGGGPVPASALARRERPRRARRGAPPRLCRPDPRAPRGQDLFCRQSPGARPVAERGAVALHRRTAGSDMSRWSLRAPRRRRSIRPRASSASRPLLRATRRRAGGAPKPTRRRTPAASAPRRRASSRRALSRAPARRTAFASGQRVFHVKFGNGDVVAVDGAEADGRVRPRRPQDGARQLCRAGGVRWQPLSPHAGRGLGRGAGDLRSVAATHPAPHPSLLPACGEKGRNGVALSPHAAFDFGFTSAV